MCKTIRMAKMHDAVQKTNTCEKIDMASVCDVIHTVMTWHAETKSYYMGLKTHALRGDRGEPPQSKYTNGHQKQPANVCIA